MKTVATVALGLSIAVGLNLSMAQQVHAQQQERPPALVEVDNVASEVVSDVVWVSGTVMSRTDANIAAEVAGRITWLAEVGDNVKAGDVIAKVDDHLLQLEQQQNLAAIEKWQASVTLLTRKQQRFAAMTKRNAASQDELDQVQYDLENARQELKDANIRKQRTAYQLAQSQVKAPFNAMIVERLQAQGEYTSIGADLIRIVDTTNVEASVRAPLSVVPYIEQDMLVTVKDKRVQKQEHIRALVPVGNANSRMMEVRVALASGDFPIGSAVRVALPHSDAYQAITVPRDALVLRKEGAFVYRVDGEDNAHQVPVKTGIGVGERVEVIGELDAEMPVVVRGAERLRPGQKVRYSASVTVAARG